jgi:predicted ATP-binding protein involved in virulence
LSAWLPQLKLSNPGRYKQVVNLINRLLGPRHYVFQGEQDTREGEFLFEKGGLKVPFPALSDGYRAYLGWIGDLLYHVTKTCPSGKKLVDNRGIVLVDEIDLHLHPKWQMNVLPTLARHLPNLQFIVTSHSPLVVGSLEWKNIILMSAGARQSSTPKRLKQPVHGLDADQVLLTDFFGMESTRAPSKDRQLKDLALQAREGDNDAAQRLLDQMSRGTEDDS